MTNKRHFFLEMKTLGLSADCIVRQIGILSVPNKNYFDFSKDSFYEICSYGKLIELSGQSQENRTFNKQTINYYFSECPEFLVSHGTDAPDALDILHTYIGGHFHKDNDICWSRRLFAPRIYASLCRMYGRQSRIPYYCFRDNATALEVLSGSTDGKMNYPDFMNKHNALHNCVMEYFRLSKHLKRGSNL